MKSTATIQPGLLHADGETLATLYYPASTVAQRQLLSLHGAGPSGKDRVAYICEALQSHGVESFIFDFSGHGESTGTLEASSLNRRLAQAQAALAGSGGQADILVGTSMGAHVALTLMAHHTFRSLILFCPALYGDHVANMPFDERFTEAIRQPGSFENTSLLENLRHFEGNTLLFMGMEDTIIPARVVELYEQARTGKPHKTVWLQGSPHVIHGWAQKNETGKQLILKEIRAFLQE